MKYRTPQVPIIVYEPFTMHLQFTPELKLPRIRIPEADTPIQPNPRPHCATPETEYPLASLKIFVHA